MRLTNPSATDPSFPIYHPHLTEAHRHNPEATPQPAFGTLVVTPPSDLQFGRH